MGTWRFPKVPILWTVYQPPYDGWGNRVVIHRTAKRLTYLSVDSNGDVWNHAPYARPSDYWSIYEEDFKQALQHFKRHPREKPRWNQLPLPFQWPQEPVVIQLAFYFPDELRFAA